jgi:sulfur-oxidizing protein SoxZ
VIPRKIINKFVCRYNGAAVFSVDLHEAVAANPFIEFHLRATESGRLEFVWEEDGGMVFRLEHRLAVR